MQFRILFVFLSHNRNIINVTEQNIVALKTVSLSIPVASYCPFYRTTASNLLEMSFFMDFL